MLERILRHQSMILTQSLTRLVRLVDIASGQITGLVDTQTKLPRRWLKDPFQHIPYPPLFTLFSVILPPKLD